MCTNSDSFYYSICSYVGGNAFLSPDSSAGVLGECSFTFLHHIAPKFGFVPHKKRTGNNKFADKLSKSTKDDRSI